MSDDTHAIPRVPPPGRTLANAALWLVQVIAASFMLIAGVAKLAGADKAVDTFARLGLGQWLRLVIGCVEVTGAVLLLAPAFARAAALVLATVLVGAVFTHLAIIGGSPAPALTLLVILVTIAAARRR